VKKIRPFTFFLFFATVLFLIFSPGIIRAGLSKDASLKKEASFEGILTLWHVNGWQTGGASVASCLKKCVRDFENRNAYVFIETVSVTPAKAAEKLASGEIPDLISFPTGFFDDPSLLSSLENIPLPGSSLKNSSRYRGKTYALPFLINPYYLYANEELFFEREIDEELLGNMTAEGFYDAAEKLSFLKQEGKVKKQVYGIALQPEYKTFPPAALSFFTVAKADPLASPGEAAAGALQKALNIQASMDNGLALFSGKQAGFLVASGGASAALENTKIAPPAYSVMPFSRYSDMVQYIGVIKTEDSRKRNMCEKFVYSLFSVKNSERLAGSSALPVIGDETLFADDPAQKEAWQLLLPEGVFPNAFAYSSLRADLDKEASGVVAGDSRALQNIRRLILNELY